MRVRILHRRKVVEKVVETNLEGSRVDGDEGGGEMVKKAGGADAFGVMGKERIKEWECEEGEVAKRCAAA